MTFQQFHGLVRPGARIRFRTDTPNCPPTTAKVQSCNWKRGYVKVHLPLLRNPQKVPAWAIEDVLPDFTDIDSVEAWLARGPLDNPYTRPRRGPLATFSMGPDGRVVVHANASNVRVQPLAGVRPLVGVLDEASDFERDVEEARQLGMLTNRQNISIELLP